MLRRSLTCFGRVRAATEEERVVGVHPQEPQPQLGLPKGQLAASAAHAKTTPPVGPQLDDQLLAAQREAAGLRRELSAAEAALGRLLCRAAFARALAAQQPGEQRQAGSDVYDPPCKKVQAAAAGTDPPSPGTIRACWPEPLPTTAAALERSGSEEERAELHAAVAAAHELLGAMLARAAARMAQRQAQLDRMEEESQQEFLAAGAGGAGEQCRWPATANPLFEQCSWEAVLSQQQCSMQQGQQQHAGQAAGLLTVPEAGQWQLGWGEEARRSFKRQLTLQRRPQEGSPPSDGDMGQQCLPLAEGQKHQELVAGQGESAAGTRPNLETLLRRLAACQARMHFEQPPLPGITAASGDGTEGPSQPFPGGSNDGTEGGALPGAEAEVAYSPLVAAAAAAKAWIKAAARDVFRTPTSSAAEEAGGSEASCSSALGILPAGSLAALRVSGEASGLVGQGSAPGRGSALQLEVALLRERAAALQHENEQIVELAGQQMQRAQQAQHAEAAAQQELEAAQQRVQLMASQIAALEEGLAEARRWMGLPSACSELPAAQSAAEWWAANQGGPLPALPSAPSSEQSCSEEQ